MVHGDRMVRQMTMDTPIDRPLELRASNSDDNEFQERETRQTDGEPDRGQSRACSLDKVVRIRDHHLNHAVSRKPAAPAISVRFTVAGWSFSTR